MSSRHNSSEQGDADSENASPESFASLAIRDLGAVVKIITGVNDRWDDPRVWRQYLLEETRALLQASFGVIQGMTVDARGVTGKHSQILAQQGWPEKIPTAILADAVKSFDNRPILELNNTIAPGFTALFDRFNRRGWVTVARADIVVDETHHASVIHREFRSKAGSDDFVVSIRRVIEPGRIEMLTFDRPFGAERFQRRDVVILRVLHDAIAPLIGLRLSTEEHICRDGLSLRLRDVLAALLEGHTEKAVSEQLGLSAATVHEYVGTLYRHFRVQSRAELMAYFVNKEPRARAN